MRAVYTLATLAAVAALCLLMLKGWRGRQRRQVDLPPPPAAPSAPAEPLLPPVPGLFVGTTTTGDWLDRIAVHGLSDRAAGWLAVTAAGVTIERDGLPDLHLPLASLRGAAPGAALAGKVVGNDGLLLLDWQLGDRRLTSGFRADDHEQHRRLADVIIAQLSPEEVRP